MDCFEREQELEQLRARRGALIADMEARRERREAEGDFEPMPMPTRQRKQREVIRKTKDDAAVVPVPAFNEAQSKAFAGYVRDRIEALVDILGGEVGSLQKLERERLDSELAAMCDTIEALRVHAELVRGAGLALADALHLRGMEIAIERRIAAATPPKQRLRGGHTGRRSHGTRLGSSSRGASALSSVCARCSARTVLGQFDYGLQLIPLRLHCYPRAAKPLG